MRKRLCKKTDMVNPTLKEMILGIIFWGVVLGVLAGWFLSSETPFFLSLAAGVFMAAGMAVHMYVVIEQALDMPAQDAAKSMRRGSALRMAAVILLVLAVWRLHGSVPGVFFGIFTLKLGAYTQPLIHKIRRK